MNSKFTYSIFITIIFIVSCHNSVDSIKEYSTGETDKNGIETGIWIFKDSLDHPMEKGRFDSGLMVGKWQYYCKLP